MFKKLSALALICLTLLSSLAYAVPLDTFQDFTTANPITSRRGQWTQLLGRGTGTDDFYVIEVDPATGEIPVSGTFTATSTTSGPTGSPVPAEADYMAGIDSNGDLQGLSVTTGGVLNVAFTPVTVDFGVTTNAERVAAVIGNATGAAAFGAGAVSAQTQRVTIATDDVVDVQATDLDIRDLSSATDSVAAVQSGNWSLRLQDGSGNAIGSTTGSLNVNVSNASLVVTATNLDIRDLSSATDSVAIGTALPAGANTIGSVGVTNLPTTADTNLGAPGASTLRTAAMLGVGSTAVSNANPVPVSDAGGSITVDGTVSASNFPATVDTNAGTAGASTIRVVAASNSPAPAGRAYADSARLDYSSSPVTTGAWVQIVASTAATINALYLFSSCGEALELGTGAAASETRKALIPPGGLDGAVPLAIASGTRLSVRGVSGSCTSGQLLLTGLN